MSNFEEEVGKRIRLLRENAGYSREKLSELANIGSKFLYEIETGKKGMSAYTLFNIANALNTSCDYILSNRKECVNIESITATLSTMSPSALIHIEKIINHIVDISKE